MEIKIIQEPQLLYTGIEEAGEKIKARIENLDVKNMVATRETKTALKALRAELNKEFDEFELPRKLIKEKVNKPYKDFEKKYKENIEVHYGGVIKEIKEKLDGLDAEILKADIQGFNEFIEKNTNHEFITWELLGIHYTLSMDEKKIKKDIMAKLDAINNEISTINTLPESKRILAKYQMDLDLTNAISTVNQELAREKSIEEAERLKKEADELEAQKKAEEKLTEIARREAEQVQEVVKAETQTVAISETVQTITLKFTATGTKEQLIKVRDFMKEIGVKYE